jgi:hypothetical protein
MERSSTRKTQVICLCCSGPAPAAGAGQVDCGCGSEVIFENKSLSRDFSQFDRVMTVLLGKNYKPKAAVH